MEIYRYHETDFSLMMASIINEALDYYLAIGNGFYGYDNWIEDLQKDYTTYATNFLWKKYNVELSDTGSSFNIVTNEPLSEALFHHFVSISWAPSKEHITDENEIIFTGKGYILNKGE